MDFFTISERDRRWNNIREAMAKRGLSCLVVWGNWGNTRRLDANLRYLTNQMYEGYLVFPINADPVSFQFTQIPRRTDWVAEIRCGHPLFAKAMSARISEIKADKSKIGIVQPSTRYYNEWGFPHNTYLGLQKYLSNATFEDATDILEEVRKVKSAEEIKCLEHASEIGEKVIQVIRETAKEGVSNYEIAARIYDFCFRAGCDPCSMLIYSVGKDTVHSAPLGYMREGNKPLEAGEVILTEFDNRYFGYVAQYNQPFSVGKPNKQWSDIYKVAVESFENGLSVLKSGVTAGELDSAFLSPIKKSGYTILNPSFHGLGVSLEEPMGSFPAQPDYKLDTEFQIVEGMVLEIEPHVVALDKKKGLHIGCPVLVTKDKYRYLGKSWKPEFIVV